MTKQFMEQLLEKMKNINEGADNERQFSIETPNGVFLVEFVGNLNEKKGKAKELKCCDCGETITGRPYQCSKCKGKPLCNKHFKEESHPLCSDCK